MSTSPRSISTAATPTTQQRRFRGLSPEERQSQRRAQLMEAGTEVFAARGYHAAGVREICAQAKLTERYFYESFQNREALFLAVYEAATSRIQQVMLDAIASGSGDGPALTRVGLRAVLELFRREPRLARIVLVEVLTLGTLDAPLAASARFAAAIEQLAIALYPELVDEGFDTKLLAEGLYGSTLYIAQQWTLSGFATPIDHVLEHCALFYEGLAFKIAAGVSTPRKQHRSRKPEHKHKHKHKHKPARSKR